jgi:CRP-like cAMP-binding protein
MDDKLRMLSRVPLFSNLGSRELGEVGRLTDEIDVPAGQALTREGQSGGEFFVILQGSVEVDKGGTVVASLGPGDFLGEIALIDGGPRTATATTTSPARLLVLARREFNTLLDDFVEIRRSVMNALCDRVRSLSPETPD